jgi:hypothetical protein
MGLLNMNDDDDDDDDDDTHRKPQPTTPTSKHAALAVATSAASSPRTPPPQYIAAPKPGYAAPIAALNLARPEAAVQRKQPPPSLRVGQNPFEPSSPFDNALPSPRPSYHPMPSPSPSMTEPHPLQPPITPITPVFARPAQPSITFSDTAVPRPRKPIMRSDTEGTLLPSRGEKGDDFWRRFSMVVKVENKGGQKERSVYSLSSFPFLTFLISQFLVEENSRRFFPPLSLGLGHRRLPPYRKSPSFSANLYELIHLQCIGVAIGLGYYLSHNSPSHQQPTVFGGSANESAGSSSQSAATGTAGSTSLLVQPTFTVARRDPEPSGTPPTWTKPMHKHKKRMHMLY